MPHTFRCERKIAPKPRLGQVRLSYIRLVQVRLDPQKRTFTLLTTQTPKNEHYVSFSGFTKKSEKRKFSLIVRTISPLGLAPHSSIAQTYFVLKFFLHLSDLSINSTVVILNQSRIFHLSECLNCLLLHIIFFHETIIVIKQSKIRILKTFMMGVFTVATNYTRIRTKIMNYIKVIFPGKLTINSNAANSRRKFCIHS